METMLSALFQRAGAASERLVRRFMPDPFALVLLLTLVSLVLGVAVIPDVPDAAPRTLAGRASEVVSLWTSGFGNAEILKFGFQIILIVVTGEAIAESPPAQKLLARLSALPRTPAQALMVVSTFAVVSGWLHWGFGLISSALLSVPMRFMACGNVIPGRLLGVFMTNRDSAGAAQLNLGLRPKKASLSFCDIASPTSARSLMAIGGKTIPMQNLEWVRTFRPLGALLGRLSPRLLRRIDPGLATLARPVDAFLGRLRGGDLESPAGLKVQEMSIPDFLAHAPRLIAHYAVRPLWSEDELGWLVGLAAQNTRLGAFTIRAIVDHTSATIGCFVYYASPGRTAHVLNILSLPGREVGVLGAMFRHLEDTGHLEARGRAQPALMAGLGLQRWLVFRHRAFAMALTRVPEVNDAIVRGDIYVGGLAGEDWSRLMCDFG